MFARLRREPERPGARSGITGATTERSYGSSPGKEGSDAAASTRLHFQHRPARG